MSRGGGHESAFLIIMTHTLRNTATEFSFRNIYEAPSMPPLHADPLVHRETPPRAEIRNLHKNAGKHF